MILFGLVFIWKDPNNEFAIIIVYVDDINVVGISNESQRQLITQRNNLRWMIFEEQSLIWN